jgi:hypothetical protein
MSIKSDLKFKIRKWTKFEKLSIRPRTVRPWTVDRPQYQDLDSPVRSADSLKLSGHGPSAPPCADRPRQAVKRGRGSQLVISTHCLSSHALHSPKGQFRRLCVDGEEKLRTNSPKACGKFNKHVFIPIFHNLMDFIKFIQI